MFPFYSICYILSDLGFTEFLDSQNFSTQPFLSCLPALYDPNFWLSESWIGTDKKNIGSDCMNVDSLDSRIFRIFGDVFPLCLNR